ncbi:MAG: hypothetical protein ABI559_11590 [Chloroflexota bacterium]
MLSAILLITMTLAGLAVVQRVMPAASTMVRLCGGFLLGLAATAWITYAVAFGLSYATDDSLLIGILAALGVHGVVLGIWGRDLRPSQFRLSWFEVAFIGASLAFSFWLMDNRLFVAHSLEGDPLLVSSETWGDTALHTALSRSFAWGANYPTEYPFFANEPIKYHFGYDFFAGVLQKGGMSVLFSFNLPGALGFTAMMMLLFSISRMLFSPMAGPAGRVIKWWRDKGVWIGLIAVALLMTNQSLGFMRYIDHPAGTTASGSAGAAQSGIWDALNPVNWWHHTKYLTIGPYDSNEKIAIFNTLNVYLTQTHLIIGMALVLFVTYGLLEPLRRQAPLTRTRMALLGVAFGMAFWLNGVLWIAAGVFFGLLLVIFALAASYRKAQQAEGEERLSAFGRDLLNWVDSSAWFIVPALALGIPQAFWLNGGTISTGDDTVGRSISLHLGYLTCSAATAGCHGTDSLGHPQLDVLSLSDWKEFFNYWLLNEGLVLPLLGVALILGRWFDRKVIIAAMAVFLLGNTVQLSRDLGGHNHKVINLWENLSSIYVGYAVVELASYGYGAAMKLPRLRSAFSIPSLGGVGRSLGALMALAGAALVFVGYALPWLEVQTASVSALKLTFDDWANGPTIILHQRPGLAIFPLLGLLVAADAVLALAAPARSRAWPTFAAGLGIIVIALAFIVTMKADTTGETLKLGPIAMMLGGTVIVLSAIIRSNVRLSIDMDPIRPLAISIAAVCVFFLVATGLIDFMTVKNDFEVRVFGDPPEPDAIQWIQDNTPRDSVFLTNWDDLYTVPTLAGRGVFLGYSPWASSAGYNIAPRETIISGIYAAADKPTACSLLTANQIDYVFIGASERSGNHFAINEGLFTQQFKQAGAIPANGNTFTFYDVKQSCPNNAVSADPG